MVVTSLVLAGGSGTRLWPLSRHMTPKQLLPLIGGKSLLQATCDRISRIIPMENQWVITGHEHYFQVKRQLKSEINIIKEPFGRNTAPAILLAAKVIADKYGEDTILTVLPSDHLITMEEDFLESLRSGIEYAKQRKIVTFGIIPTHPETGYGYIRVDDNEDSFQSDIYKVSSFVEKPDLEKAKMFLREGKYLWNSGIFVFHIGTLLEEAGKYCNDIMEPIEKADLDGENAIIDIYNMIRSCSIDYAIMEHTQNAYVVPSNFGWSDVGNWKSYFEVNEKDEEGNVIKGEAISLETKGCLIMGKEKLIVTIGLEDTAIIDTDDVVMVSKIDKVHLVSEVIKRLKDENSKVLIENKIVLKPWGNYSVIEEGDDYKIKKIIVLPGQKLSKQMHYHRSEHWVIVRGTARVTKGEDIIFVHENESVYIPQATVHRLENPGIIPLEIIEAQCGSLLDENDIIRFEDDYDRALGKQY